MKKALVTLALLFVLVSALPAQTVPPALMVKKEGVSVPLGLSKLRTEVRIIGSVAETTTTMTFANPSARVMEGDLYFPLPEGATISGYALDIGGTMVDGVAVEKHEARQVFEQVVRQGIDPGLVEWTAGNNFQTRVFPIPAHGSRTIRVQYVTELVGGRDGAAYLLPLRLKEKVHEFSLRVEVVKSEAPPKIAKGGLTNFAFAKWRDSFVAETNLTDAALVEDLVIALPPAGQRPVVVEKADDGQFYFAIQDFPAAPQVLTKSTRPAHVVIFWDASGSRGAADHKREIGVVRAYFQKWLGQPGGAPIQVDLALLRNAVSKPKRFELTASSLAALVAELEQVAYDGGTQLGAVGPLAPGKKPDFYWLFTDGISNFGRSQPAALDAPVYVFSADSGANHALLHSLAMTKGGRYFNLTRLTDAEVVAGIGRPSWSFLSATVEGGQAEAIYPELPQPVAGRFLLAGKLKADVATVTVNYGLPGQAPEQRAFSVARAGAAEGSLLRRFWAQKKLAELMISQKRNKQEITTLGKRLGMVTPYTSLLVLDTLEQYVRYEITPPKSLPAMRDEYLRQVDTLEHQRLKQKADKLTEVLRMWQERVKWWETEFKYAKDFKYQGDNHGFGLPSRAPGGVGGMMDGGEGVMRQGTASRGHAARMDARRASPASAYPAMAPAAPAPVPPPGDFSRGGRIGSIGAGLRMAERADATKAKDGPDTSSEREPGIVIKAWDPKTPYLDALREAKGKQLFAAYMKNRATYGSSPAFFLDCADFFREQNDPELALQVLSNIAELELEDAALLRVLGHRLEQIGQLDLAVQTFEQVLELRPEEPQSYRDLALVLARRAGQADTGRVSPAVRADYARAMELLVHVVMGRWDARFPEIEVIALEEINRLIPRAKLAGVSASGLDPRLSKLLDVDVRIVMTWHADNTDIDLWVTEPSGEKAYYGHNRTTIGGLVSRDFTQGYGPEEYMVRRAAHGVYKVEANYFGSRATRLLGPVTVQVDVYTHYGRADEQRKSLTIRLKDAQETVRIGEIEF
jgi:tetratricopeptide (TPR) repeat protein